MDINWLYEQAKQKGLDAINSIKSTTTPQVPQKQVPLSSLGIKPIYEPVYAPMKSVVSVSPFQDKTLAQVSKPLQVKPSEPIKPFELPKFETFPKISEMIFGDVAKQANRNINYQWNKLTGELVTSLQQNLVPALRDFVLSSASAGIAPSFGGMPGTAGFAEGGARDIALLAKPEASIAVRKAETDLKTQAGLGALQAAGLPGDVFNRSIVQPWYQNKQLDKRQNELGIVATPEERYAASLGDLNQSENTLYKRNPIEITNTMSAEEKAKAEENNRRYYIAEVQDTAVSLIDLDLLLGLGAFGKDITGKGITKLTRLGAEKTVEKATQNTVDDLLVAVGKGDKNEIEKIIKRPLTAAEDLKIDSLNDLSKSDLFSKEIKDLREQTFVGKTQKIISEADQKINQLWEERKTKQALEAKNTEYDKAMATAREQAAGTRTVKEKLGDAWLDLRRAYWNKRAFSYETIDRIAKETGNLKRAENPKYFADSLEKTSEQTETFLNVNGYYKAIETAVQEAKNVFKKGADVIDNFGNFLEARRRVTLHDLGIQKLDDAQYKTYLDVFNERKDRYAGATKQFDEFINKLVLKAQASGILTPDEVKRFLETGDYAPFYRIFNEFTSAPRNSLVKSKKDLGQQSVFRQLGFNEGVIKNPLEAAELMTYSLIEQSNRNIYASKWGELIRNGYVKGAYIIRDAKNVIRQAQIQDTLEEVNKARERLTKVVRKTKNAVRQLTTEVNGLSRRGIKLSLKSTPGTIDPAVKQKLLEKIKVLNKNREKLVKDLETLNLKDLELQKDKAYFGYESGIPKPQLQDILDGKVVKKENLLLKLMFKTDGLVKEKAIKYLNKNYGLFFNKMTDKQLLNFFRNTNMDELETFINLAFDLKPKQYDNFVKKLSLTKSKEADVIKELNDAKNAAFENKIVDALYNKETEIIKNFNSLSDELKNVIKDINTNKSNIYYNDLFNSLVRKSPDELIEIKKKISKKEPILNNLIDTLIKQQEELDIKSGYAKELKAESELLDELDKNGQPFISWLNNGVREIAVVNKKLAEEFFDINTKVEDKLMKNLLNFFVINPTKLWKAGTTTFIPDSRYRQIAKDTETIGFFFDGEVRNSILNPINFLDAIKQVTVKSPEYSRFVELGGGGSFYKSLGGSQTLKTFAAKTSKKLSFKKVGAMSRDALDSVAGGDEVARRFQIFKEVEKDLIKRGMDPREAELEAIWQSNNVLPNYFQTGTASDVLELALTYSKIKMQSGKVMLEMFKNNPVKATMRIAGKVAIPISVVTAYNMLDADRAKVYEDVSEDIKKKNLVIVPLNPINPDGSYKTVTTIAVEETLMSFANPFRRATEEAIRAGDTGALTAYAKEFFSPKTATGMLEGTTGVTVPTDTKQATKDIGSSINPIFRGPIELGTNWEFFRERNIVDDSVKDRSAINQWDDNTSLLAKEIGLKTNTSPMIVDWYIRTYGQGLAKYSQRPLEEAIKAAKNDPELTINTKSPVETLVNSLTFQREVKPGTKAVKESYEILNKKKQEDADRNFVVKQAMADGDIEKLKQMAPLLTEAQFNQLYTSMQKQAAQTTLTNTQKVLFNSSDAELKRIEKEKPELAGDIAYVKKYKDEVGKLPNLDTRGFQFMPSESKGTGKRPPSPKFGGTSGGFGLKSLKVSKPKKIAMPKPKKLKVKKAAKPKRIKVAKLKPIKRTRNI